MSAKKFISLLREARTSIAEESEGLLYADMIDSLFTDHPSSYKDFSDKDIKEWGEKITKALELRVAQLRQEDPDEEVSWETLDAVKHAIKGRHKSIISSALLAVTQKEQVEALVEVFPISDPSDFVELLIEDFDSETFISYSPENVSAWMDNYRVFAVTSMKLGKFRS